ncbi:MAG: gliding motility-associated C-terminal domain-containing protein, partial [Bacteroidales bacterium]|nr:gliding motility-associated C-terminal domain-containing protein [Bacteroidales bacterium]
CESYDWDGRNYTTSGDHEWTYHDQYGADSVVTLHLTINHGTHLVSDISLCESYMWHGMTCDTSGTYTYEYMNEDGCPSVDTLHFTRKYAESAEFAETACESYEWNGIAYLESGDYQQAFTAVNGCDSVVTLHLTINHGTYHVSDTSLCESIVWHGMTCDTSGTYTYEYTSGDGCPSADTLHFTRKYAQTAEFAETACDSYTWNDSVYTASGDYPQTFTVANGCDSVVTLHLTIIPLPELSHTPNTTIMAGDSANLWASGADVLYWTDGSGNILASGPSLTVSPATSTMYYLTGQQSSAAVGNNLVANGDFEQGNVGFISEYDYNNLAYEGAYYVGYNGQSHYPSFAVWPDHTSSTGLYMIVNGAGTPNSNAWTQSVSVEPNTDYAFSAWICNLSPRAVASGNLQDVAQLQFSVNGTQLGEIFYVPETAGWTSVYEVWNSGNNTTATITILNQNSEWAGNDFGLDDISFIPLADCSVTDSILVTVTYNVMDERTICDSELPYVWNGVTFEHAGTEEVVLQALNGADSVVTLHLTINHGTHHVSDTSLCESYEWHGMTCDTSGAYTYEYTNGDGCPSADTLHFTRKYAESAEFAETACDSYTWNDSVYTASGAYPQTFTAANGCDSVVTLHLTVNHSVTELVEATACESYAWNDSVYTASGDYSRTFTAANGCDSVVTLHLTVNQTSGSLISASVVENSLPCMLNGSSYMEPGTYYQHFTNAAGCDSTVTLQLTVYYNQTVAVDSTVCGDALPVVWNDSVFTASGTKTRVYPAANGADSIVVMTLHVNSSPVAAISGLTALCADSMVTLTADSAYSYLWSTGDTTQAISVTEEGFYTLTVTNEYGCEVVTIHQLSSLGNPILSVAVPDLCAGDSYTFSVGHQGSDNIHLGRGETTLSLADTIFLPDGVYCEPQGCSYRSPLTFTAYAPGSTIQSPDDIHYVRLNMEHSYIGDLYINITCPNGQKADLLKYGGSGSSECNNQIPASSRGWAAGDNMPGYIFLGNAYDYNVSSCNPSAFGNEPGEGWNYCWSDNTTQGYTYSTGAGGYIYRFVNATSTGAGDIVDSSDVAAGTQFYHPDDPFSNLIGCPLNGPWYIEVQDGWSSDNGYIFGWELALSSEMLPDISFELAYATADGPWITALSDSLFQIDPPANLSHDTTIVYTFTVYDTTGCAYDTTVSVNFYTIRHTELDTVVCEGFVWNDSLYTTSGQYVRHFVSAAGCDSVSALNLTVNSPTDTTIHIVVLENALPYQYNEISYVEAGTYTQHLTNAAGCDSILTVVIDVFENVSVSLDSTVCETALPLTWNDSIFTAAGTKATTVLAANGADSTITMLLTVIPTVTELVEVTACESYNWNGTNYTESGDYPQTFTAAGGCDSIVTLHLTVHHGTHNATTETACDSYEWHDSAYTASGVYTYEYTNADGCPSVDTLHLVVIPLPELTLSPDTTIIFGTSVSLWASGADYYQWFPTDGLSDPNSATPLATPLQSTCYQVTGYAAPAEQDNVVVNGGFEAGYTGFTTDYNYVANPSQHNLGFGNFVINEDAHNVWPLQHQYGYGGDGLFMIVDGASYPNATVWSQTVNVQPNTSYDFSAQIVSLCASDISVARLQFVVNGVQLGPIFEAPSTLYQWVKFHDFWNSGNDTVATITILNQNTNGQGNDFGLDDIVFAPMPECFVTDSVCVSVIYNVVDTMTICESELPYEWNGVTFTQAGTQTATLAASTGADSIVTMTLHVNALSYSNFDTAVIENALPLQYNEISYVEAGTYTQHLTNAAGCDSILTVTLTVFPNVTTELDSTVCESDLPVTWNGVSFTAAGTDSVTLQAATGADSTVVMTLHVVALPVLTHSADTVIMPGASVNLWATGADIMAWTDADGNPLSSGGNLTVAPTATTTYYITAFNEGNSVVTNGDFESGNTGFTTAYQYNSNLWPEGNYYVGTNAHDHHGNFPNWYDHTTGSGLYMIVNGATVAGTNLWTQTVPVIPHTSYAFSAWVCTLVGGYSSLARLQFSVNATQLGEIFHSPSSTSVWNRYYEVWYSGENTTATLTILNQNTTGGGNDFGVDDIQFSPLNFCNVTDSVTVYVSGQTDSTVCADALPFIWNGVEFTVAGTQTATITASDGTDSVVVMNLHVNALSYNTFDTAVVENALPLQYNGISYIEAGTYTQHLTNAAGCDSILTVNLTVFPNVTSELDSAVCETAFPFTWNDSVFTAAGTKTTMIPAHTGADSTITMTLTIIPTTYGTFDTAVIENSLPCQYNDISYFEAGTYTQYLTNAAGCDSVLTVLIDVIENVSVSVDSTVCEAALPLTWNDSVFTAAGTKTTTILAHTGADSVVTMTLHVNPLSYTTIDTAVIENALPLQYNEISYIEAGTYTQNFTNTLGCDSILTIHLTVYQNVTTIVDTTVCAADLPYTWHGHNFTAAGTHVVTLFTSHGADSVVTYHLSVDNIAANIGNITHITCYGESTGSATASVTGGQTPMTYAWTNASGTNIATTTSIGNRPAGAYTFTVTDHVGCTATASVTLNTLNGELQPGTIAASQEVCDGEDIAPFTGTVASGGDNGSCQWQISTNGTDWTPAPGTNNAQTYTYPNSATNSFSLRRAWVSQTCGTVYSNTVTVSVWPNSSDTISASICQGEIYDEYNFNVPADQTSEAGEYTFEQHHATGHCDSAVILLLTVNPTVAELVEATVCEGEGYDANGFSVSPQETIGESVLTRVQNLQTVNGCDSVVTLQLTVIDTALRIEMLTDDFCEHNEAALTVLSPMQDYVWSTGETATTIVVSSPGIYTVTASEGGCSATARIRVEGCHYELVLPNAITPSRGDGLNDCFYISEGFIPNINLFKVYIYNRWGELVFYSTDKNFRWYGEYRGQTQYQTVYNYVIEYTDTAGRPQRLVGQITVL